jgi:hypothetical protein
LYLQNPITKNKYIFSKTKKLEKYSNNLLTLILKALLKPEAKKPPNGPITELKMLSDKECNINGYIVNVVSDFPYLKRQ